jgi:hypothetical protein
MCHIKAVAKHAAVSILVHNKIVSLEKIQVELLPLIWCGGTCLSVIPALGSLRQEETQ